MVAIFNLNLMNSMKRTFRIINFKKIEVNFSSFRKQWNINTKNIHRLMNNFYVKKNKKQKTTILAQYNIKSIDTITYIGIPFKKIFLY